MKYKLISPPKMDILETVLSNRNITNLNDYLYPPVENMSPLLLDNMQLGINIFRKHMESNSTFAILIDCDADGYTSSATMYLYLKQLGIEPKVIFHEGKKHGLSDWDVFTQILDMQPDILIIPDASSNEAEFHEQLAKSIDILVLDHHQADNVNESKAIIINNQTSENFPNKSLAGVGVVYKFLQQLDFELGINLVDALLDLVAVGCIADVMDLNNLDTRYLVLRGLSQIYNPFIKEIQIQEGVADMTITDIAFKVSPLINSIIRVGKMDEKKMLFDALVGMDYTVEYKYRGKIIQQTVQQAVIRIGKNCKSRQNTLVKKYLSALKNQISSNKLLDNKVLILNTSDVFEITEVSGLVATKLAHEYKRPTILLGKRDDSSYGGSARGFGTDSFKDICESLNKFSMLGGHHNAFGCEIPFENIKELNGLFNNYFEDVDFEVSYNVDYIINANNLRASYIETIAELSSLWGNFVEEPIFLIKDVFINSGLVKKNGIVVSFSNNGIPFIKNYATSSFIEEFTCGKERGFYNADIKTDIVVKFRKYKNGYYCEIVDYDSSISKEIIF